MLFAKGLRGVSRLHLMLGIFGYLASPLWLAFLLTFNWIYWFQKYTGLSDIPVHAFMPYPANLSGTAHALLIFVICMVVIMLPKIAGAALTSRATGRAGAHFGGLRARHRRRGRRNRFFHAARAAAHALAHALRRHQSARHQRRLEPRKSAPPTARPGFTPLRRHWGHTLIGLVWGAFMWGLDRTLFWWFTPVLAGMVCPFR